MAEGCGTAKRRPIATAEFGRLWGICLLPRPRLRGQRSPYGRIQGFVRNLTEAVKSAITAPGAQPPTGRLYASSHPTCANPAGTFPGHNLVLDQRAVRRDCTDRVFSFRPR